MNCKDVAERVDDYVDGVLSPDAASLINEHLAECEACRADMAGLHAIAGRTAALPATVAPVRDLWPGIEARLTTRHAVAWRFALLAAAAVLLVCIGALLERHVPDRPMADAPATATAMASTAEVSTAYEEARGMLLATCAEQGDSLPPETSRLIRDNLAVIDNALAEIGAALAEDPANVRLLRMLVNTQNHGIKAVRRTASLLNET